MVLIKKKTLRQIREAPSSDCSSPTGATNAWYDSLLRNSWQQEKNKQQVDSSEISNLFSSLQTVSRFKEKKTGCFLC